MSPEPLKRRTFILSFLVISLVWSCAVYFSFNFYTSWKTSKALSKIEKQAQSGISELKTGFDRTTQLLHYVSNLLSRYESIRIAVVNENNHSHPELSPDQLKAYYEKQPPLISINEELAKAVHSTNAISNLWIMKNDGTTIAANNAGADVSFVGTRFDYREYFIAAMKGKRIHQYAMGHRSREAGLFFSTPIYSHNKVVGVMASKITLPHLAYWISKTNGFLIDKYGVIIYSAIPELEMKIIPGGQVYQLSEKQRLMRYNRIEFETLHISRWEDDSTSPVMYLGNLESPFYVLSTKLFNNDLHFMTAIDASSVIRAPEYPFILAVSIVSGVLFCLILTVFIYHFQVLQRIRRRRALTKRLVAREIMNSENTGKNFAILYVDIDSFKEINASFGYEAGDKILQILRERILGVLRKSDSIIRRSQDTFITLIQNVNNPADIRNIVIKIQNTINNPIAFENTSLRLTACIGIAMYPTDGQTASEILQHADTALESVKEKGRGDYAFYHSQMSVDLIARNQLDADMKKGLENGEFFLVYQPQLSLQSGDLIGCEALIRWRHPARGMLSPMEFIPIAERSGFINSLGSWILDEACRQTTIWQKEWNIYIRVAVNISPLQFQRADLLSSIKFSLEKNTLLPQFLELEMTETLMMADTERTLSVIHELQELGIHISIDDFGTGYSSLAYLRKFEANALKIDRAFVRDMVNNPNDKAIISAIINMAHSLDYQIIAEGVETIEQYNLLKEMNCHAMQGYWFSKPLLPDEFAALYQHHSSENKVLC